jgi:hypothetical protein
MPLERLILMTYTKKKYKPKNRASFFKRGASFFQQKIESVRTLAGQTATISFWAKASSGTPKVSVELEQVFGSGGSPSSATFTNLGVVTLSTSWTRYSVSGIVASISGKTIGTNNDDCVQLNLWTSAGSNFSSRTNSIGIQNNTIDFWGVQLEQNYQPTPFEQRPIGVEIGLCQRYYEKSYAFNTAPGTATYDNLITNPGSAGGITTGEIIGNYYWSAWKRIAPTVNWYDHSGNSNRVTRLQMTVANHGNNVAASGTITQQFAAVSSASGNSAQCLQFHFTADAEL